MQEGDKTTAQNLLNQAYRLFGKIEHILLSLDQSEVKP
jgi:hypothetical protein